MKSYFLMVFFSSMLVIRTTAQQHITLSSPNTTGVHIAGSSITLLPGFSTGGDFEARIDASANCLPLASAPSAGENYVITYTPRVAFPAGEDLSQKVTCQVQQQIQYFDGLGRPLQKVQVKGSPHADKDIVTPNAYDIFGREATKYLPYASASSNGSYKSAARTEVASYYNASQAGISESFNTPYSQTLFESSPLNRVIEQGAPGNPWQPSVSGINGSGHTIKTAYATNSYNEVRKWFLYSSGEWANSDYVYYSPGQLYKKIIKDENWQAVDGKAGTIEEFTDKAGRIVLKRVWETASKSLNTAYIYDHYGNLRYVVPPLGDDYSDEYYAAVDEGTQHFQDYIYGYHYDHRQRLVEKKVPGKGWEYIVYNELDQVVATQDAEQRKSNQWLIAKYDVLGRAVMTGLSTIQGGRTAVQTAENVHEQSNALWEAPVSTGYGYSQNSWPGALGSVLTINYYDNYNFPGNTYGGPSGSQLANVKGLLTATKVNVLGTSTMLLTANYYDTKGRVVQSKADNYVGGSDLVSNTYSFTGELLSNSRQHSGSSTSVTIATRYTYDHMGRKNEVYENINNQGEVKLSALSYTETGQLLSKGLHNGLQSTAYAYNERRWLKNSQSNQFSYQLHYQDSSSPQWNGNISSQLWGATAANANTFTYRYDKLNRLLSGSAVGMSETISYDMMGNIKTMNRDGQYGEYTYTGNRLNQVVNGGLATEVYTYDDNGNATYDGRNQKSISYNILNLPQTVSGGISYTYDATGRKLVKQSATTTHYENGIQYTGGAIDFIQTEEGRALNMAGTYKYEYNLTDHLGNVRYSFDIYNGAVRKIQEDNYYPFGKRVSNYAGSPDNKYLYNGKELQDELGQYDYGARFYDPVIARWNVVDPLAEKAYGWTPYRYAFNNPIRLIDLDGRIEVDPQTAKKYPALVSYVKNLSTDWKNKSQEFKDAFMKTSGLNASQVSEMLTFGKGPKLEVANLDNAKGQVNGTTTLLKDPATGKLTNAEGGKGLIHLDNDVVNMYEKATTMGDKEVGKIMVESTLFHEGTHFGNAKVNGNANGAYKESGKAFETEAYGKDINRADVAKYRPKELGKVKSLGVGGQVL